MIVIILFIFALFLWKILTYQPDGKCQQLPPSPSGWLPVLGHMWRLDPVKPFATIDYWSRQLGDVFSMYFGSQRVIVISRERLMKKAFLKDGENFSGRPKLFVHESCWGKGHIISDGPQNTEMRKFLLTCLREKNGDTHYGIQAAVHREIDRMILVINEKLRCGIQHIDIQDTAFFVVGNVLTSFLLGRTYPHESQEFRNNARWLERTLELMHRTSALTFLPWLRYFPPNGFGYWEMKRQASEVINMMRQDIRERIALQDYKDKSRTDLASTFLRKMDEIKAKKLQGDTDDVGDYNEDKLALMMTEMFFAGIQTECNTFGWAFLYFVEWPEIQEKCRAKILEKFGPNDQITWGDRRKLPYIEAAVMEVQRASNIAPFSVFHRNFNETTLDGYFIPANSVIMMNLYSTMVDPNCFPDPYKFDPERYLDKDGEIDHTKMAGLYPYGLGRRMCMGENIARCELFTVICALLQRYRFKKIPGKKYSLEQKMQLTIHPDKYELFIEPL